MDFNKLGKIIDETTQEYTKESAITYRRDKELYVTKVYAMPHETDADSELEMHDTHFIKVGVKKNKAEELRIELVNLLGQYPEPDRLSQGISYIEVGAVIGSQDRALRLFALGESLGLWEIITPEKIGMTGQKADESADSGMVMITGFKM